MQTIRIGFTRKLTNAAFVSAAESTFVSAAESTFPSTFGPSSKMIAEEEANQQEIEKLAKTDSTETAKSSLLLNQELLTLWSLIEQQVQSQTQKYSETLEQFQELTVRLAMEIATAVVGYEVNQHETRVKQLLDNLIKQHKPPSPVVAYVNRTDLERLRISCPDTLSTDSMLQLKPDDSLPQGDVRIETLEHRVIASCQQQLASIQLQLLEYLSDARLKSAEP